MIRTVTQGNSKIVTNGLQLYYDVGNTRSYSYLSPNTNLLYNLAKDTTIIDPNTAVSASAAIIDSTKYIIPSDSYLPAPYSGLLENDSSTHITIPYFSDLNATSSSYTIEIIMNPIELAGSDNYIVKSGDNVDGLYIKYDDSNQNRIEIGSVNGGQDSKSTNMRPPESVNEFYQFVFIYNNITDEILVYVNGVEEVNRKQTLYDTFEGPLLVGYKFSSIRFCEFRLYNRALSLNEINTNKNAFNSFQYKQF